MRVTVIESATPLNPFSVGNLVAGGEDNTVVMVTEERGHTFSGVVMRSEATNRPIGTFIKYWLKDSFTQFTGTITIEL